MKNIYLIGFMGSGKSAVAAYLMRQYGMPRVEMDREIEADCGMTIPEFFAECGEEEFRNKETLLLQKITEKEEVVVSCGGGVPLRHANVELMQSSGTIVYLQATPETIFARVRHTNQRPLLQGRKTPEGIRTLMEQRAPYYEAAADVTVVVDAKSIAQVAEEVRNKVCFRTETPG